MARFEGIEEALMDIVNAERVCIRFSKGMKLTEEIGKLTELTELILDDCPSSVVFPKSMLDLKKLNKITIFALDEKLILPEYLGEIDLNRLEIYDNFPKVFPNLCKVKEFRFDTRNLKRDLYAVTKAIPDLNFLSIGGVGLKEGELPPEIRNFKKLETLYLSNCSLNNLPDEFGELTSLKVLSLNFLPMRCIPEVIGLLPCLEKLEIDYPITSLPKNLGNLKTLRELILNKAFNEGAMIGTSDLKLIPELKPLPQVISQLTDLTVLELACCGVTTTDLLKPLVNLKKLRLSWAPIKSCEDIGLLHNLEELELDNCHFLNDFSPLGSLKKLEKLNISNTCPISLDFLNELSALEELDIQYLKCNNISALFRQPLKILEADSIILEKWDNSKLLQEIPGIEDILRCLTSGELQTTEKALFDLSRYIDANSGKNNHAIEGIFSFKKESNSNTNDGSVLIKIPELDSILEKFIKDLSSEVLAAFFDSCFRKMEDDYYAAMLCVKEITERKDLQAEKSIIETFIKASSNYSAGHREMTDSIQDQLIDDLFPQFESEALIMLISDLNNQSLKAHSDDGMQALFIPAFRVIENKPNFDQLLNLLEEYANANCLINYSASDIEDLFTKIENSIKEEYLELFRTFRKKTECDAANKLNIPKIKADAKSREASLVENAIDRALNLNQSGWDEVKIALFDAFYTENLSFEAKKKILKQYLKNDEKRLVSNAIQILLQRDISFWRNEINEFNIDKKDLSQYLESAMRTFIIDSGKHQTYKFPYKETFEWAESLGIISSEELRKTECINYFISAFYNSNSGMLSKAMDCLDDISVTIDLNKTDYAFGGTYAFKLAEFIADSVNHDKDLLIRFCKYLPKLDIENRYFQQVLSLLAELCLNHSEDTVYKTLLNLIPAKIENKTLAYNLARAEARSGQREAMLSHIKLSLNLGLNPEKFRMDKDFCMYLDDKSFIELLESIK